MSKENPFEWYLDVQKATTYIKELKDFELELFATYVSDEIQSMKNGFIRIAEKSENVERSFEDIYNMLLSTGGTFEDYNKMAVQIDKEIIRRDYLGYEVNINLEKFNSKKSKYVLLESLGVLDYLRHTNPKTKEIYSNSMKDFYSLVSIILGYDEEIVPSSKTFRSLDSRHGTDHKDVKNIESIENKILLELEKLGYK